MTFEKHPFAMWSIGGLAVPLLALLVGGLWFYHAEETSARLRAEQQLASVAHLKADQFVAWRNQRLSDAAVLTEDALLVGGIAGFLTREDSQDDDDALRRRLREVSEHGRYADIVLVDVAGRVRFSLSGKLKTSDDHSAALALALRNYQPVFMDLAPDAHASSAAVRLIAPLFVAHRTGVSPLGAVILVSDAAQFLQPLTQSWVKPSATTEILLARPEGEQLLLLAKQSNRPEGWENSRAPVERADSLAAAVVQGRSAGFVQGRDHRGVESLAYVLPVAGSDWLLIAKDETAQIFGVWRFRAALLLLLFAVLAAGLGSLGLFVWQAKRKAHYKALYDAESRLRHSLERHSITLKAVGDGIIATDSHGRVELLNPVAETLTGWNQDEARGRPLAEVFCLVDEETREQAENLVTSALCETLPTPGARRHLLIARNGAERTIAETAAPIRDENGAVLGVVLAFRDQTEERRTQQIVHTRLFLREFAFTHTLDHFFARALQETAALVDSPCVRCLIADPHLRNLTPQPGRSKDRLWRRCAQEGAGAEEEVDLAAQWCDRLHDGRAVVLNDQAAMENGEAVDWLGATRALVVPIMRTGKVVAVLAAADKPTPYTEHDQETVAHTADYIWRLVEQKQVEEELLASERQYRTLYRSMMDAFVVVDLQGNIRECNDAYGVMLGYANEELKQMSVQDLTPARWLAYEEEHVNKQLMHGGCSNLYEKEYRRKDGTVFPVELRTFLLVDNNGAPAGMSAIVRDVSERKKVESDRAKLQEQLHQARKMESVGQLAGGVAHDFNNMLSVIIGYAELALRKLEPPSPLDNYFQEIVKAGRRSAEMTRQLLAFARKQTIAPKILDLNDAVGGVLKMLRRLIGEDIELKWLPGDELWPIKMDPSQMDQLLANLCVNARDAIDGVGKITIETGKISFDAAYCAERTGFVPGDFVLLAVSDNGKGMERDILDKIFEPFFTTKGVGQGTGLGLATVYGVVKQNNGFVNVYSEPGVGTTFRIYLPRQPGGQIEERHEETSEVMPMGQGETLLVVEDEATILALNRVMLEQLGYTVLAAGSADEALPLAKTHGENIRLLITDVIMPEMNGRDLARLIATCCPTIKTLFMSGYTANVIAHRGVLDEGVHFIAKPFATRELAVKIRELLHG